MIWRAALLFGLVWLFAPHEFALGRSEARSPAARASLLETGLTGFGLPIRSRSLAEVKAEIHESLSKRREEK